MESIFQFEFMDDLIGISILCQHRRRSVFHARSSGYNVTLTMPNVTLGRQDVPG